MSEVLLRAAQGAFPAADGSVQVMGSPDGPADAVLAFTAHHVIAADVDPDEVGAQLAGDDLAAAMRAPFLTWLGERIGAVPGMVDVVLVVPRTDVAPLHLRRLDRPDAHPRVRRAQRYRTDVAAYTDPSGHGAVILGRGLAGRLEVSIEVDAAARGRGLGRRLATTAAALAPEDEPLFAQVSPGNVASLRAFLAAGFEPIGAEVLFLRSR